MEWTKAQKETIETREKNILVSAAAGSGKTAVLIERIKTLILKEKTDLDRFLITTFTNAASAEMKERLEKAFREELAEPGADKVFLKKQLSLLPRANISTFHTFALEIMRRYFYLTDLEPGFRIGDDIQISIMKGEAVDLLFESRFEEDYERFRNFLTKYSGDRNEKKIKKNLIALYDEMRSIPDYMDWAVQRTALLHTNSPAESLGLLDFIRRETMERMRQAGGFYGRAALLLEEEGIEGLSEKAAEDQEKIDAVLRRLEVCDSEEACEIARQFLLDPGFHQMRAGKAQQEAYNEIKEQVAAYRKQGRSILDDLAKKYYRRTREEYDEELRACYEDTKYMTELLQEFETIFNEKKKEKNMVDFDDVMHYAIEILRDDMAAAEYRDRFRYIFIDEFQDSNLLQEKIVQRIAGENNLFMVGDVKQSIYKFRLAEPEIFRRKYETYRDPSEIRSVKIDLNSNFRSKRRVTETINKVFETAMEGYDEDARLHCAMEKGDPGYESCLHIIDEGDRDGDELPETASEIGLIRLLIEQSVGMSIYDVKMQRERPTEYRDIVVLSRNKSSIGQIERYLNNEGIPAYGENTGSYFESVEIQVFLNLLRIIDNRRQDIPLLSVMRCPVFGFEATELAAIRIAHRQGSFFEAVRAYGEEGVDEALQAKVTGMMEKISYWKEMKQTVPLDELVRVLLYDTGYFDYCSSLPAGRQRISNLRMLVERAEQFEKDNYSGLHGFLAYVEAMKDKNLSVGEAKGLGESENVVRVMTVHKSKGLEFPVVILAGAGRSIRFRGSGGGASIHKDFAIGLPHVDCREKWHRKTLLQRVIEGRKAKEELDEEVRILYVALTRAMDQLLITGTVKGMQQLEDGLHGRKSFLEMLYRPMKEAGDRIVVYEDPAELTAGAERRRLDVHGRFLQLLHQAEAEKTRGLMQQLDQKLSFAYPYAGLGTIKSKYSVTELNQRDHEKREKSERRLSRPQFSTGKHRLDAAEAGTVMHLVMEKLDFGRAFAQGEKYIAQTVDRLVEEGTLSTTERQAVKVEPIAAFFSQAVGRRAALAQHLYKEREFVLQKTIDGVQTIVQGIIDCYFEESTGLVLIDYKNSYLGGGTQEAEIRQRYSGQLRLYQEALEAATGKKVKESYLYLFELKKFIKSV